MSRLERNHEEWLKFADAYWTLDNGKSAVELSQKMLITHVENARNTAYGYDGYLDEAITNAGEYVDKTERSNLKDTVDSLCDLGHGDSVATALKHATLKAIHQNTGAKPVQPSAPAKITTGKNLSQLRFNGATVKRSPQKSFDAAANKVEKISQTLADSVNLSASATAMLREAMAKKAAEADGRLFNPTKAAATLATTPIGKGKELSKQEYDNEETWTHLVKMAATGRMKSDITSQKSVEIPVVRLNSFSETRDRLPPEWRNPTDLPQVHGMVLTDLPKPPDIEPPLHDPQSMAALTLKNHQMQQRQWNANLQSPAKPKQGFDPVNGAV